MEKMFFHFLLPFSSIFNVVLKNEKKWFPIGRKSVTSVKMWSLFKNWLSLTQVTVSTCRKNLQTKQNGFHEPKNPFPLVRMKNFVGKGAFTGRKINYHS